MSNSNINTESQQAGVGPLTEREKVAAKVPFVLRAWWLREFQSQRDLTWSTDMTVTGALWSAYSDPLCDQGNIDHGDDAV